MRCSLANTTAIRSLLVVLSLVSVRDTRAFALIGASSPVQLASVFGSGSRPSTSSSLQDAATPVSTAMNADGVSDGRSNKNPQRRKKAIVVGAGPSGIATALTLAKAPHYYDVRLLESSPQTAYDPTRAFLYNVNLRGQSWTNQFPNIQRKLEERGVKSGGFTGTSLTIVPADPNEALPKPNDAAPKSVKDNDVATKAGGAVNQKEEVKPGFWIPRNEMVALMLEAVQEHEEQRQRHANEIEEGGETLGRIDYCPGIEFVSFRSLQKTANEEGDAGKGSYVSVTTKDIATGTTEEHEATLVVGADGMNSKVRDCLANQDSSSKAFEGWSNFNPKKFVVRKWTSPASHQRIKVLQLPPQFQIPDGKGGHVTTKSENIYALRSKHTGPRNYLSLGLLPMKNNDAVRPTNIVTRPDHEIWGPAYKDGEKVREWFEEAYPRFPFHKDGGLIDDQEWDRFAKAQGTTFPACQYSPGMGICSDDGTCGICLVGDAIHAFPPDIGQGVNAGLCDVVALDRALCGKDTVTGEPVHANKESAAAAATKTSLKANIERYQKQREPEIAALIRLARFGAPYQYKQPHRIDRIRRNLWTVNVLFRVIMNKLTFGLVPAQCIILSQNHDLTFRQVMRRADMTTGTIKVLLLGVMALLLKKKFGVP